MPVAIRSLNGYYGFLDSLRSLEMTTVTELFPIYRPVSNYSLHPFIPSPGERGDRAAVGEECGRKPNNYLFWLVPAPVLQLGSLPRAVLSVIAQKVPKEAT